MASFAEIANDLMAQSARFDRTGNEQLVRSLRRGASAIRELQEMVVTLEAAAQAEADRYERYVDGADL